tara:strand:+ start:331 stop:642 length:312 start_codon:yes stop_codon:yes gene_type:complete
MVKVVAPRCHQTAGMPQVVEQVLVQTFIPNPAVEAFHKPVLHTLGPNLPLAADVPGKMRGRPRAPAFFRMPILVCGRSEGQVSADSVEKHLFAIAEIAVLNLA